MKKIMLALTMMLTIAATGKAMSYEQARNEALFLTDKMAYELNLTNEQYEAAYEINLDYLMGVTSYDDVYGNYWERRNLDMSYVLFDWQWRTFCAASYFYRPLYWRDGYWHFGIYARYPHRDYFYFGRPVFYASYRGGHAWHVIGGRGYYYGRRDHFRPTGRSHFGMLDRWNRGDFNHSRGHISDHRNTSGGMRHSSTRTTVNRNKNGHGSFHNNNSSNGGTTSPHHNKTFGGSRNHSSESNRNNSFEGNRNSSFGGSRNSSFGGSTTRSSGNSSSFGGSHSGSSRSSQGGSRNSGGGTFGRGR